MKHIWRLVKKIKDARGRRRAFLLLSACIWGFLGAVSCIFFSLLLNNTILETLIFALCGAAYGGVLLGIYGGALFLYKNA